MIVSKTAKEKNTVTFEVSLDSAEFEKYVQGAYLKNKSKITVTGFRKGKAPRMVIEGMYGKEVFYEDAINDAAPDAFAYGVTEQKLEVVGRPAVENADVTDEKGLVISYKTDVYPEVVLGEYKGITAEKESVSVTEDDISAEIEKLRKQNGRLVSVEREAQNGDTVNIDYVGTVDGVEFDGGKAEGYNLVLGSNSFVPGYEEQLVGIKAGEERTVNVTFPENYHEGLAGKAAVFQVKCNEVKEEQLPEVDDDFAADNDYDTLDAMKAGISAKLTEDRQKVADNQFNDAVINKACENMTVDIPEGMIEDALDEIMSDYSRSIQSMGMTLEQYVQMLNMSMDDLRKNARPSAETRVKTDILLRAVAEAESVEATDEEVEKEYADAAAQYNMDVETVKKAVPVQTVKDQIIRNKTVKFITDSAVATEKAAE